MREIDAPAVYLSRRFWTDFGAATILATGVGWFFGVPAAPIVGVLVGGTSAWQAQRPRVQDEVAWARAVLANAEQRRLAKAVPRTVADPEGS
ncbi:MAG: hypothetical protein ACPHQP_05810 [Longimicrobiales bacterium]